MCMLAEPLCTRRHCPNLPPPLRFHLPGAQSLHHASTSRSIDGRRLVAYQPGNRRMSHVTDPSLYLMSNLHCAKPRSLPFEANMDPIQSLDSVHLDALLMRLQTCTAWTAIPCSSFRLPRPRLAQPTGRHHPQPDSSCLI